MLYCPSCNNRMWKIDRVLVQMPFVEEQHEALAVVCMSCTAISEVRMESGFLRDYPGFFLRHLRVPHNAKYLPRRGHSLIAMSQPIGGDS